MQDYYERDGWAVKEVKRRAEQRLDLTTELKERDKENQRRKQLNRIKNSRFNPEYQKRITKSIATYISEPGKKKY